jgi:phosphomannomutase
MTESADTLHSRLTYEPKELQFGTSGRRGEVVHLTQLEIYINALAELQYLQALPVSDGGIVRGDDFYFASDLRPSSTQYVKEEQGYGEICQAIECAIRDAGMRPVNLGCIPTPALAYYALARSKGSIMVTGSHIPFNRNGYKLNTSVGELLKEQEEAINAAVRQVREQMYSQPFVVSRFNERGLFKSGHRDLPDETGEAKSEYVDRYLSFFEGSSLSGKRILVYQHSAVGRDVLVEILERFGADVIPTGRSERFIPIDTENIDKAQLATIQALADEAGAKHGPIYAIVSTDGDSDRPLILGVNSATAAVRFFGGDLVGMVVAEYLGADAVVVPISCTDAIDRGHLAPIVQPKTRIGSPYVIAGMKNARSRGAKIVCGWEANGGFLTGSDISRNKRVLKGLPTRDAVLPILGALFAATARRLSLIELFAGLPQRFSRAALLKGIPRPLSLKLVQRFLPDDSRIQEVIFAQDRTTLLDDDKRPLAVGEPHEKRAEDIRSRLQQFFTPQLGFGTITRLNYTDGVRMTFSNGDIAHFRPSGNADELRIYGVADTQERADAIAEMGIHEPHGILRLMEKAIAPFISELR